MREIIDRLLELELKATPAKWDVNIYASEFYLVHPSERKIPTNQDFKLIDEMRNNIKPLLLRMKALEDLAEVAREYFSRDKEAEDMYDTGDMMGAGNAWRDCEDLLEKYYEVTNEKY